MATVLPSSTRAQFEAAVDRAAALLRAGEVVALPTETVYGLAADAFNARAVERIFAVKDRPGHNPIIVHIASLEMARACASSWPALATRLAAAFWPGPLTLVLPRSPAIPDVVTAGGATVGIRWPNHPVIQAVIRSCGFPLAAPSANRSGEISPTTAEHVQRNLGARIDLIIDGGTAEVGIESTVLDLSLSPPAILRPGMISSESLRSVVGVLRPFAQRPGEPLRSPGLLLRHYAPKARLLIWSGERARLDSQIADLPVARERIHLLIRDPIIGVSGWGRVCVMPQEPRSFAKALYAELHGADEAGAEIIVVQAVPDEPAWQAIGDRLRRAAA